MIVYKLLKTPLQYYVYDRNKNKILNISKEEYEELDRLSKKQITEKEAVCLKKYQKCGYLKNNIVENIVHPETKYIKHYLEHRVQFLILQITQSCNLRCDYCTYSGQYNTRGHSGKSMTWELAKKSIDYLYQHSNEIEKVRISFYGGEPLLEIDLIKKCVEYVKETYPHRITNCGITTNGTLLSGEIADFLIDNQFSVTISLDGSKKDHDANRKFANGEGSFDTIINNIKAISKHNKEFIKNIRFNTVLNPKSDYGTVRNYFSSEDVVCDAGIGLSLMEQINHKGDISFSHEFINIRRYDYFLLLMTMVKKLKKEVTPKFMAEIKSGIDIDYTSMEDINSVSKSWHHSGPCIAGAMRMFVNTDGVIYPCEKAIETSEAMKIGEIDSGTDAGKASKVMNIGKISERDCKNCWAINWCSMCALYAEKDGKFDSVTKRKNCAKSLIDAQEKLLNICALKEFGYKFGREEMYV